MLCEEGFLTVWPSQDRDYAQASYSTSENLSENFQDVGRVTLGAGSMPSRKQCVGCENHVPIKLLRPLISIIQPMLRLTPVG